MSYKCYFPNLQAYCLHNFWPMNTTNHHGYAAGVSIPFILGDDDDAGLLRLLTSPSNQIVWLLFANADNADIQDTRTQLQMELAFDKPVYWESQSWATAEQLNCIQMGIILDFELIQSINKNLSLIVGFSLDIWSTSSSPSNKRKCGEHTYLGVSLI